MDDIGISPGCGRQLRRVAILALFGAFFASPPAFAQQPEENPPSHETTANAPADIEQGLWPSPNLLRLMLTRWAEEAGYEYDLDDQQREKTRKVVVQRWTKFLDDNREDIQPLTNEFLEMRMEITPPTKTHVQEWARRARPFFDKATKQIEEGTSEYREILRPNQRIKFEIDAIQMKVGLGFAQQKFTQWEKGEFEPDDFWEPIGPDREARRDERRRRRKEREAKDTEQEEKRHAIDRQPADPIDLELDSWQRYAADFISMYGLDPGQRTTVLSCLTELRDRATAHRDRYRDEINRLEGKIASNRGADDELAEIKDQLNRLYGPIDEMFKELQARIEQVPTGDQRATAKAVPPETKKTEAGGASPANAAKSKEPGADSQERRQTPPDLQPQPLPTNPDRQ
jgi:hypothetical protein